MPSGDDGAAILPPVEWLATAKGAHSMQTDASNRFAFVPHISGRHRAECDIPVQVRCEDGAHHA